MFRIAFLSIAVFVFLAPLANASVITIDTLQSQICAGAFGCGQSFATVNGLQITVTGQNQNFAAFPTASGSAGFLVTSCVGGGFGCAGGSLAGLNLYVVIHETSPLNGTAILAAALSGSMSGTNGTGVVTFTTSSATIGGTTYQPSLAFFQIGNPLVGPNAQTFFSLTVTDAPFSAVPEPARAGLVLAGLLGAAAVRGLAGRGAPGTWPLRAAHPRRGAQAD